MQSSGEGADQRTHRAQEQKTDGQRSEEEFVVLVLSKDGLERQQLEFPSQEQFEKEFRSAKKGNHWAESERSDEESKAGDIESEE